MSARLVGCDATGHGGVRRGTRRGGPSGAPRDVASWQASRAAQMLSTTTLDEPVDCATRRLPNVLHYFRPAMSEIEIDVDEFPEPEIANVVFPRKLLKKFIQLYKELPCLWDRNISEYKHKQQRHEAITRLTELVQKHDPTATRVHVLRKIESLRACVRREHKRVRDSRRKASSPDEIYKPHLWYYDLFSFVFSEDGFYNYNYPMKRAKGEITASVESEDEEEPADDDEPQFEQSIDNYSNDYGLASNMVEVSDSSSKQYPGFDEDANKSGKRHCTEVEDEYDAIGINVAAKLRNLPANMRILAEKLINDVLFQAQLNGLNPSTSISTPDPFKQDPM